MIDPKDKSTKSSVTEPAVMVRGVTKSYGDVVALAGIDIDIEKAWDERRELYKSSNLIIRTRANVQTAEGDKNGLWTTAVAAVVLIP